MLQIEKAPHQSDCSPVALQPGGSTFHKSTLTLIPGCRLRVEISRLMTRTLHLNSKFGWHIVGD